MDGAKNSTGLCSLVLEKWNILWLTVPCRIKFCFLIWRKWLIAAAVAAEKAALRLTTKITCWTCNSAAKHGIIHHRLVVIILAETIAKDRISLQGTGLSGHKLT